MTQQSEPRDAPPIGDAVKGVVFGSSRLSFPLAIAKISVSDGSPVSIYEQIYRGIRNGIETGDLPPGTQLPTGRELASVLNVARNTVVTAYSRLVAEGYLLTNRRRGTRVADNSRTRLTNVQAGFSSPRLGPAAANDLDARDSRRTAIEIGYRARFELESDPPENVVDGPFALSVPDPLFYPRAALGRLLSEEFARARVGNALHQVVEEFQLATANYLRRMRGVSCSPAQIIPVDGLENALNLMARVMIDPGHCVYVEDPANDIVRQSLRSAGAQLVTIPCDECGADVDKASGPPPRIIFASPSVSFPSGSRMSETRRAAMLRVARDSNALIFECDTGWELSYGGERVGALQANLQGASVVYFGSFNLSLGAQINLGYVVVPLHLVDAFTTVARRISRGPEPFVLAAIARYIEGADYAMHIRTIRSAYSGRMKALVQAIKTAIAGVVVVEPAGGLHVTVLFENAANEQAICRAAAGRGLPVTPLSRFYYASPPGAVPAGIVLGIGNLPDKAIATMVRRLAEAVNEMRGGRGAPSLVA
jgi:GntR family transcriptional regulator/MocR family aminotransferase